MSLHLILQECEIGKIKIFISITIDEILDTNNI